MPTIYYIMELLKLKKKMRTVYTCPFLFVLYTSLSYFSMACWVLLVTKHLNLKVVWVFGNACEEFVHCKIQIMWAHQRFPKKVTVGEQISTWVSWITDIEIVFLLAEWIIWQFLWFQCFNLSWFSLFLFSKETVNWRKI